MADPDPATRPKVTANDLSDEEFDAWYGRWVPLAPTETAELLAGSGVRWWIAGGFAIDAAAGVAREHGDIDVAIDSADLAKLRAHLPQLHLWEAHAGSLTPLLPGNPLTSGREGLWARHDATGPWLFDVLLSPVDGADWVFKRDHEIRMPMSEAILVRDDVPYLAPQLVLLYKARLLRDKDQRDFDLVLPHLDGSARGWLAAALDRHLPGHRWRALLR